ncbi:MAG: M42 family metallopeptidase [Bacilli bacterium]
MEQSTLQLFKTLTEMHGAPGFEHEVRAFIKERMTPYAEEFVYDRLGSVFAKKTGDASGPRIMVAGHMDEVGFMVVGITASGLLRFQPLGGWWSQVLLAQRVEIMTGQGPIVGVISSTPPHLLDEGRRQKPMDIKEMLIDIGADDEADARAMGVREGQSVVPICPFTPMANPKKILAKAWDNRYGCGLAVELMEHLAANAHPNVAFIGATVQEEVGLRGAKTAASLIKPDIFFALDASPANDMTGSKHEFGRLGDGVLMRIMDRTMIMDKNLREFLLDTCESNAIRYQYFVSPGGTDAGSVHVANEGIPSAVIGVPSRYIHSSASILHVDDYAAAKELLFKLMTSLDRSTYETILGDRYSG